jgi:ligand-binding sensor domain-containing protein
LNTIQLIAAEPELIHYTGSSHNYITGMVENGNFIWVGTALDGIRKINTLTDDIEIINEANSGLKGNSISCMLKDKTGKMWIGTEKGLNFYDGNDWICYDTTNSELKNNRIYQIALDSTGKLWISYYYLGLTSFDGTLWKNYNFIENIKYNYISSIQTDKSGNIWIIAEIQGLIKFDGTNVTVFDTLKTKISYFRYSKIAFDKNDNLWITDFDTNLVKFDYMNWQVLKIENEYFNVFNKCNITFDNQNNLLLPDKGILKYDGSIFTKINRSNSNLSDDFVNYIFVDSKSDYWIGTQYDGLAKYTNGKFIYYDLNLKGLIDNQIKSVNIDKNNKKWILTYSGVSAFDGKKWDIFTNSNSKFPNDEFHYGNVCVDDNDNIWVSSSGYGLWMFNDTSLFNISDKYPEFVGKNVYKLINHKSGFLYVSSNKALSKFDGTNWEIVIDYPIGPNFSIDDTGTVWHDGGGYISYFGKKVNEF